MFKVLIALIGLSGVIVFAHSQDLANSEEYTFLSKPSSQVSSPDYIKLNVEAPVEALKYEGSVDFRKCNISLDETWTDFESSCANDKFFKNKGQQYLNEEMDTRVEP